MVLSCLIRTKDYLTYTTPLICINLQWNIASLLVQVNVQAVSKNVNKFEKDNSAFKSNKSKYDTLLDKKSLT